MSLDRHQASKCKTPAQMQRANLLSEDRRQSVTFCWAVAGILVLVGGGLMVADSLAPPVGTVPFTVTMSVSLSSTEADFDSGNQTKFLKCVAGAAGALAKDVTITKVLDMRRPTESSLRVTFVINADGEAAATRMVDKLTPDAINAELMKSGLPEAKVLEAAAASAKKVTGILFMIGAACIGLALQGCVIHGMVCQQSKKRSGPIDRYSTQKKHKKGKLGQRTNQIQAEEEIQKPGSAA